jgi:hypothetical protein
MTVSHRLAGVLVAIVVTAFGAATPAAAQDRDAQEVSRYALTESGLAKFAQATRNISAVPGACERKEDDDSDDLKSIDQMVAKLNSVPGIQAAIQSAGFTSREYVVFMFSMMQSGMAAWAASQPGGKLPPGVSQANVDFYKKHDTAIAAIGEGDPCGDDAGDDDGEDPAA